MWSYNYDMYSTELAHHGVKGMHWYQHIFGSEASAMRKKRKLERLQKKQIKAQNKAKAAQEEEARARAAYEKKRQYSTKKKYVKSLSDSELNAKIDRLALEKKYKDAVAADNPASTKGKKFVLDILEKAGKDTLTQLSSYAMGTAVNAVAKGITGNDKLEIVDPKHWQKASKK